MLHHDPKETFRKLSKVLRNRINSSEKSVLEWYAISILIYGSEFWTDEEKTKDNRNLVLPKKYQSYSMGGTVK